MSFLSLLTGLSLAWLAIRFLSDLPRQLPILLELLGKFILRLAIQIGVWLVTVIFNRAYRAVQYLLSTPQARQLRYRLGMGLQEIISIIHQKLRL